METRAIWTDLIAGVGLEIADVFDQGQEEYIVGLQGVFNLTQGEGAQRNFAGKTGVGRLERFDGDGDNIPGGRRFPSYNTTASYNNYGKFIDVSKNAIEDRDFAAELDEMKDLSIGANFSQDESAFQILNGGFANTGDANVNGYRINYYGDGEELFSTVHPTRVPGASTQSNASSTSIPFGHDNLETGKVALVEQQTDDGLPVSLLGKVMLAVPPALEREGMEETMSELTPESANNAINVFRGNVDMVSSIFLGAANNGSDTTWYLLVPGRHKLFHEMRQQPVLESDVNVKNKVVTFTVDARWADYVRDWRRTWASQGDNSAYSS